MSAADLTADERDQIAHAIGHRSAKGCSVNGGRNYYVTQTGDPLWASLVQRGLAMRRSSAMLPADDSVFLVTAAGRAAVEADPRSRRPAAERSYSVRFRGREAAYDVRAASNAKARYMAASEYAYIWNMSTREAFARIESCRLA